MRDRIARERDPAGFTPDVLVTFEGEPELIDVVALHLLERHFAPGLHEEILEAVGLELGTPVATRRRDMTFRAAVLEAYLAECWVCGFSLRLVDGLIGVDAAHIRWHAEGGPDEVPNGLALCALHHRLFDHGAITVREDLRVRVARSLAAKAGQIEFGGMKHPGPKGVGMPEVRRTGEGDALEFDGVIREGQGESFLLDRESRVSILSRFDVTVSRLLSRIRAGAVVLPVAILTGECIVHRSRSSLCLALPRARLHRDGKGIHERICIQFQLREPLGDL